MSRGLANPRSLALTAVMTAIIFTLTQIKLLPTPDGGYIHPGDAGIFFSAFAFGPWVGAVSGGLGTALADVTSGYGQWAIFSFLIHGAQGWAVGRLSSRWPSTLGLIFAAIVGGIIVVVGYIPAGIILMSPALALQSALMNTAQVIIGGLIGIPLYILVREAYPPIGHLGRPHS